MRFVAALEDEPIPLLTPPWARMPTDKVIPFPIRVSPLYVFAEFNETVPEPLGLVGSPIVRAPPRVPEMIPSYGVSPVPTNDRYPPLAPSVIPRFASSVAPLERSP